MTVTTPPKKTRRILEMSRNGSLKQSNHIPRRQDHFGDLKPILGRKAKENQGDEEQCFAGIAN